MFVLPNLERDIHLPFNHEVRPVRVTVPARIDFLGTWSDTPPYFFDRPSGILHAALTARGRDGQRITGVAVILSPADHFSFFENQNQVINWEEHRVLTAVFQYLRVNPDGLRVSLKVENTIPHGSGLGGSSILALAIITAFLAGFGSEKTSLKPSLLFNHVLMIEQLMGSGGGWQDQVGAGLPGVKYTQVTFEHSSPEYSVTPLSSEDANWLSKKILLVDTGIRRKSLNTLSIIREKSLDHASPISGVIKDGVESLGMALDFIKQRNIYAFAEVVDEYWRKLVCEVPTLSLPEVERISLLCKDGLLGGRLAGAGGGGFMILIFSDDSQVTSYQERIALHQESFKAYTVDLNVGGLDLSYLGE